VEFGFDLLSLAGNPRRFMRTMLDPNGPGSASGLTYLTVNGYR